MLLSIESHQFLWFFVWYFFNIFDIQLKDTQETIQLSSNEAIQPGQTSTLYAAKAPASGNVDDIEILKYKISLLSGVYMEYDTKLKQYNWS